MCQIDRDKIEKMLDVSLQKKLKKISNMDFSDAITEIKKSHEQLLWQVEYYATKYYQAADQIRILEERNSNIKKFIIIDSTYRS